MFLLVDAQSGVTLSAMTAYLKSDHKVYALTCTGSGLFRIRGLVE